MHRTHRACAPGVWSAVSVGGSHRALSRPGPGPLESHLPLRRVPLRGAGPGARGSHPAACTAGSRPRSGRPAGSPPLLALRARRGPGPPVSSRRGPASSRAWSRAFGGSPAGAAARVRGSVRDALRSQRSKQGSSPEFIHPFGWTYHLPHKSATLPEHRIRNEGSSRRRSSCAGRRK